MKFRVTEKNKRGYDDYFARGITVCERWHQFENFLADMGECPKGMEIDRIDNDGNYEPGNCRWVTRVVNQSNRRVSINVTFNGVTQTLKQWSDQLGISYQNLRYRIQGGWSTEEAFKK